MSITSEPRQATSLSSEGVTLACNPAQTGSTQSFSSVDWASIVALVQGGGETGMEQLYRVFSRGLRYYLVRQLGAHDFEDKMHEIFLITVRAIHNGEIRQPECLPGFIRTVAHRQVAGYIEDRVYARRREADMSSGVYVVDRHHTPEQEALLREKTELMKKALGKLKPHQREVLVRFYLQEQRPESICREMNLTETQFRLIKSRAKAAFGEHGKKELTKTASPRSVCTAA
jgi:RNA polymerase sigma-70 factor, ECF subfamily